MELRLYSFVNYYLSPMQQGIQTGHMAVDLVREYSLDYLSHVPSKDQEIAIDWADNWKTFVVLNGGNNARLNEIVTLFDSISSRLSLPWTSFYEDEASLNGTLTCVGIVVPETYFNAVQQENGDWTYTSKDPLTDYLSVFRVCNDDDPVMHAFIKLIRTSRLA